MGLTQVAISCLPWRYEGFIMLVSRSVNEVSITLMSNLILTPRSCTTAPEYWGRPRPVADRPRTKTTTVSFKEVNILRNQCCSSIPNAFLCLNESCIDQVGTSRDTEVAQPSTFRFVKEDGLKKVPVKWWLSCIFTHHDALTITEDRHQWLPLLGRFEQFFVVGRRIVLTI